MDRIRQGMEFMIFIFRYKFCSSHTSKNRSNSFKIRHKKYKVKQETNNFNFGSKIDEKLFQIIKWP